MLNKATRPNLYDILKVSAIMFMIIDHLWYFLFPDIIIFREIWRRSFPLFLMLIGFNQSSKISRQLRISTIIIQLFLWVITMMWFTDGRQLNILIGIVMTKFIMRYIWRWSDIVLVIIFVVSIFAIPYTRDIIEYGTCILASSIFAVLLSRWIPNKSGYNSNISTNYRLKDILKYLSILSASILMVCWFFVVNNDFLFGDIWWMLVIVWWIVSIGFIYKLCRDNFTVKSLVWKKVWNTIIWINNNAVYIYIIHVIFLYIFVCLYYLLFI